MVIHPFLGIKLVDPAISHDDPASFGGHTTLRLVAISTARRRRSPPKDAASPGSPTGLVVAGLTTNTAPTRPVSLEVCVHAEETALSTDLFPTQRINSSIKLRVVAQV